MCVCVHIYNKLRSFCLIKWFTLSVLILRKENLNFKGIYDSYLTQVLKKIFTLGFLDIFYAHSHDSVNCYHRLINVSEIKGSNYRFKEMVPFKKLYFMGHFLCACDIGISEGSSEDRLKNLERKIKLDVF